MPAKVICDYCGDEVYKKPSDVNENNFCNIDCYSLYQRKRREIECDYCGEAFSRIECKINENSNYCSRECSYRSREERIIKKCEVCEKFFEKKPSEVEKTSRHFCSKECYNDKEVDKVSLYCILCGEEYRVYPSYVDHHPALFCSSECRYEYMTGKNAPNWRGGHDLYYGSNWSSIRERVLDRDGRECVVCGVEKCSNGSSLHIHHIKPFRSFENKEKANDLDNLVSLCEKHHREFEVKSYKEQLNTFEGVF